MNKFLVAILLFASFSSFGLESNELPEPLTFNDAINFAKKKYNHTFLIAQSGIDTAKALALMSQSDNDFTIYLKGHLRKVGVTEFVDPSDDNDSKISLFAKKKLYDFGLSHSKEKHNQLIVDSKLIDYALKQEIYLNKVIEAYFNVLRADNEFLIQNEAMSIAFVRFQRRQDNVEFGLSSDLDILKAQSHYESVRQKRYLSEANQRYTRQYLSELLGAINLPDQLEVPKIDHKRRLIEDVDSIFNLALVNSKQVQLYQTNLMAAKQAALTAAKTNSATIDAVFEISEYERDSSYRDDWRASINFNVPLYSGNKKNSAVLLAQAQQNGALAKLSEAQSATRMEVLTLWQKINQLTVELEGAIIKQDYRDLYLENSRADYELEYQSDLGDAMVEFTRSRSQRYDVEFDLELAWRDIVLLVGLNNQDKILKK